MDSTTARFDQASAHYRTESIRYRKLCADRVTQLAAPSPADVILDVGCGTGTQLIAMAGSIQKGIGVDRSPGMVNRANLLMKEAGCVNLAFHVGDIRTLERALFRDKVNKIISNYALHHLQLAEKKAALQRMIQSAGDALERIAIGDLMFFDDPESYVGQYGQIGYGPGCDLPCYADELASLFNGGPFTVTLHKLHPLVGVLTASRNGGPACF